MPRESEDFKPIGSPTSADVDFTTLPTSHSWVYACVRAISHAVAGVPLKVQKKSPKGKDGWIDLGRNIWEVAALEDVNSYQTQSDLLEETANFLALQGKHYWEISRNSKGKLTKIFPMHPNYVTPIPGGEFVSGYRFKLPGDKPIMFDQEDTIFFKFFHPSNDYSGLSPLMAAREGVLADFYSQRYNKAFFKNGAVTRGALESDRGISDRALRRLRKQFMRTYTGVDNQHKVAILEEGLKYKNISMTPKDMEFVNLRKFSREEILAVFGVYPVVLGLLEGSSYANAYTQTRLYYENTVSLYLNKISSMLTKIMRRELSDPSVRVFFDLSQVPALRPALGDLMQWATPAVNAGILLINEVREVIGRKPVSWGSTWFNNSAMIPIADESGILPSPIDGGKTPPKREHIERLIEAATAIKGVGPDGPEYGEELDAVTVLKQYLAELSDGDNVEQ